MPAKQMLRAVAAHVSGEAATTTETATTTTTTTDESARMHAESEKYLPLGVTSQFRRGPGLKTQAGQGGAGRPSLAWRFLRIPTHFPLNLKMRAIRWSTRAARPG